ncbi:hypothetical protein EG329_004686 [Mollisiaceae sp. DMI_Dod_QoI]|nr:hypothetical protein EG329_004686 [Helotiales sp. DMI_Dod_QoI]
MATPNPNPNPKPPIHTYHCLCTTLLLTSTHSLATLPRRSLTTGGLDSAIILPLPSTAPPSIPSTTTSQPIPLPKEGYTLLLPSLSKDLDRKPTLVRREDGFEKRVLYRCARCGLVIGYELLHTSQTQSQDRTQIQDGEAMDIDTNTNTNTPTTKSHPGPSHNSLDPYTGKILYILPAGLTSTEFMLNTNTNNTNNTNNSTSPIHKISPEEVSIQHPSVAVFE